MTNNEKKSVSKVENNNPQTLIEKALNKGASIEVLERMFDLQEKWEKKQAKKEFDLAISNFQKKCPIIKKQKIVKDKHGRERYSYAPLESIILQVKDIISKNGLSYQINIKNTEKELVATCIIKHTAGHSESSSFAVPIGTEEYMTDVQKYGARATFAKRYAFCDAFGIMTGEKDIDGDVEDNTKEVEEIIKKIKKSTKDEQVVKIWNSLDSKLKANPKIVEECKNQRIFIKEAEQEELKQTI